MNTPHVIEALAFEVDFASPEQAWQLEAQVAGFAQGQALQVIDEVFGQALGDDEVLQIDALEIDLGQVDGEDLALQWAARLREQLVLHLAALRAARGASALDAPHPAAHDAPHAASHAATPNASPPSTARAPAAPGDAAAVADGGGPVPAERDPETNPEAGTEAGTEATQAARWRSRAQADLEALLHFLRHGRLPWGQAPHTDPAGLARRCTPSLGAALLQGLRALPDAAAVRARLVRQFPADWLCLLEHALRVSAPATPGGAAANPFASTAPSQSADWPTDWAQAEARLQAVWAPAGGWAAPIPAVGAVGAVNAADAADAADAGGSGGAGGSRGAGGAPGSTRAATAPDDPAPRPAVPSAGGSAARLRRLKALLVDDAPLLDEDDVAALLALWPPLRRDDPDALRDQLLTWGAYARVRRRMAALWPEPLLMQLPGLWLPPAEQAQLVAALQQAPGVQAAGTRRQRWQQLLRLLLAGGGAAPPRVDDLLAAWHGHPSTAGMPDPSSWERGRTGAPPTALGTAPATDPAPDLRQQLQALTAGPPAAGRAGLRRLGTSWTHQRLLAAMLTPGQLVRCLGWWLPAEQAAALGTLAFEPLPAAWQATPRGATPGTPGDPQGAERRCQWFLHHVATTDDAAVTATGLVRTWWQALALQRQCDADALLADLQAVLQAGDDAALPAVERRRARAWWRWLVDSATTAAAPAAGAGTDGAPTGHAPRPEAPAPGLTSSPSPTGPEAPPLDTMTRALRAADWAALASHWTALARADAAALRGWARSASGTPAGRASLARCPPPLWQRWLRLLLPDLPAVAQAAEQLSRGQGPHLQPALREQVLAWVLAQPASAPAGDQAATTASVTRLLQHLVDADPAASVATVCALALHAAAASSEPAQAALLRDAAQQLAAAERPAPLAAAPSGPPLRRPPAGRDPVPVFDLSTALRQPAAQARHAIRHEAGTPGGLAALAAAVDGPQGRPLMALFFGGDGADALAPVLVLLMQELAASAGAADPTAPALRRQVLKAALWTPPPSPALLAVHLLERAAARLDLPPPLLVQRLQARAGGRGPPLLNAWAAGRSPVHLGPGPDRPMPPARGTGEPAHRFTDAEPSGPVPPPPATPATPPDAAAVADVVTLLRGGASPGPLTPDQARRLLGRVTDGGARVCAAAARELESPLAARRAAQGLAPAQLLQLVCRLRPADAPALQPLWPALQSRVPAGGSPDGGWPAVARVVLRELFEFDRPVNAAGLLRRTDQALGRSPARAAAAPQKTTPQKAAPLTTAPLNLPRARASAPLPPVRGGDGDVSVDAAADEAWDRPADGRTDADASPPDGPLFVDNAGLVLLAPYLPRLFGLCGLADGKRFVDAAAAGRAVLLSQYLVSGDAACAEPLLLLNKLLCGLPLHAPVPREIELAPAERETADGLLLAVIAHWSALGRTSPAGLRQTFLQREGRLSHAGEAWQLEVPPQTFDMLLDRLPWGYATLRFPWMPEVLHVQWR